MFHCFDIFMFKLAKCEISPNRGDWRQDPYDEYKLNDIQHGQFPSIKRRTCYYQGCRGWSALLNNGMFFNEKNDGRTRGQSPVYTRISLHLHPMSHPRGENTHVSLHVTRLWCGVSVSSYSAGIGISIVIFKCRSCFLTRVWTDLVAEGPVEHHASDVDAVGAWQRHRHRDKRRSHLCRADRLQHTRWAMTGEGEPGESRQRAGREPEESQERAGREPGESQESRERAGGEPGESQDRARRVRKEGQERARREREPGEREPGEKESQESQSQERARVRRESQERYCRYKTR